jgi:MarR family transcriptional regulator, organic hydroperoxide resistance regulator
VTDKTEAVADLLSLERQVCFALAVANRNVLAVYRPILEPMGLTHPQYLVMLALWERSPQTVTEISRTLQFDPATLSPLLKRLEAAGLVTRSRSAEDERQLAVGLTAEGRRLRRKAERVPPAVVERLGVELSELEDLRESLNRINLAARRALGDLDPVHI